MDRTVYLGIRKVKMGGLSSGKQFTFVFIFRVCLFAIFFAAEGAVAWDIALSLEIPTVDGKRLKIPDDNINLEGWGGAFRIELKILG